MIKQFGLKFILFISICISAGNIFGQLLDIGSGQFRPGTKWLQIKTDHYHLIFPQELQKDAQRVANTVDYCYSKIGKSLDSKPLKIPLLLSNQNVVTNGYVALAPRRTEWYSTPPQSDLMGTGEWYQLLAIHEGRHIMQFEKFRRGFTKFASSFFGDYGHMIFSNIAIPMWLWEGDAVCTETALTNTGRGRMPSFDMGIRTNRLSGIRYNYFKASMGSYRTYIPNHYELGYQLVANLRKSYGDSVYNNILNFSNSISFIPFAFDISMRLNISKGVNSFYKSSMKLLEEKWKSNLINLNLSEFTLFNERKGRTYTNYYFPQDWNQDYIIAIKYGMGDRPQIVKINKVTKKEERVCSFMPLDFVRVQVAADKMVWNENIPSLRWGNKSHSDLFVYDLLTNSKKRISWQKRYFAPDLSSDGSKIAAVEFDSARICSIVLLETQTGKLIKKLSNPENYFISNPAWSEDGKKLVYVRQILKGKSLVIQDIESEEIEIIIPEGNENISNPMMHENYVFYNSPYTGIDNIFAINMASKEKYLVTSDKFGAYNFEPTIKNNHFLYSNYSKRGYDIAYAKIDPSKWTKMDNVQAPPLDENIESMIVQENHQNDFLSDSIPNTDFEVSKFRESSKLFKFHSWFILPAVIANSGGIVSNNLMNTLMVSGMFTYFMNENSGSFSGNVTYAKYFPIFNLNLATNQRAVYVPMGNDTLVDKFSEDIASFSVKIPLDLSGGIFYRSLQLSSGLGAGNVRGREDYNKKEMDEQRNGLLLPWFFNLNYVDQLQGCKKDVSPPFAFVTDFNYQRSLPGSEIKGETYSLQADLYFRGIFKYTGFKISGAFEKTDLKDHIFLSRVLFPRGYDGVRAEKLYKAGIDYAFPICTPDFSLGSLLYIKRITGKVFYDYGQIGSTGLKNLEYKSAGGELLFNFHIFNFPVELSNIGLRISYLMKTKEVIYEPTISFSL